MNITKAFTTITLTAIAGLAAFFFATSTFAQQATYPIPELGLCRDQRECRLYCQIPDNFADCTAYGTNVLGVSAVLAESTTAESRAAASGVTFPIPELGNCTSVAACRTYCSASENIESCSTYAQKFGLKYQVQANREQLLDAVQAMLGCDSRQTCRQLCAQEDNRERCRAVAQSLGLQNSNRGGERKSQFLQYAQTELGCDTLVACKQLCSAEENRQQCRAFGKKYGADRSGSKRAIPSGQKQLQQRPLQAAPSSVTQ